MPPARHPYLDVVGQELWRDFTLDDFQKGEVSLTEAMASLDEWGATGGDLFDALGDHVDQDRRILDD